MSNFSTDWWLNSDCFDSCHHHSGKCNCGGHCKKCHVECTCIICKPKPFCSPRPCPPRPCPPRPCPPQPCPVEQHTFSTGALLIPQMLNPDNVAVVGEVLNLNASVSQFVIFRVYQWGSGQSFSGTALVYEAASLVAPNSRVEFTFAGLTEQNYEVRYLVQPGSVNLIINTWGVEAQAGPTPITFGNIEGLTVLNRDLNRIV